MTEWIYLTRTDDGRLVDDDGNECNTRGIRFSTDAEAEQYLEKQDIRASLR